ncbi:MAG: DMT family transporter [Bacteroidales bacterium]
MKISSFKFYAAAVFSMLFWGLSFVWFKIVVKYYDPITIIFLRLLISSSLLLLFLYFTGKFERIRREDFKWFLILAFTQPFCYFLGESFGLRQVSSTIASVIISTIPVFSPLVAYYTIKEKFSAYSLAGIFISFAGVLIMVVKKDFSLNVAPVGIALLFFAVLSALFYGVIIRRFTHHYSPLTIITAQNIIGMFYFLPLFLVIDFSHFITVKPTGELLAALLQLAVFASTFAYLLYIVALRNFGLTRANIFTNLIPIFTAIASFFILGEMLTPAKIAGIVIVICGVIVSQWKQVRRLYTSR